MDTKEFAKLAKTIGFPRTADTTDHTKPTTWRPATCYMYWSKRGGHAGAKMIDRCIEKAFAVGFKAGDASASSSPDGNVVIGSTVYTKTVNGFIVARLTAHRHYGVTKDSNFFSMTLTGTP